MSAVATMTIVTSLIGIIDKILAKTPNFDQKRKLEWEEIKNIINIEKSKERHEWDADLLLNLYEKMETFEEAL